MSTEVKPTDWDAEDNMWEPTPSGGGSGLPSYTSADKGKVLTIGEGEGYVTTVIVPEQTVTYDGENYALLNGANPNSIVVGAAGTMTVNGQSYDVTAEEMPGGGSIAFIASEGGLQLFGIAYSKETGATLFAEMDSVPGTYTVSLTQTAPSVEPKWGTQEPLFILKVSQMVATGDNYIDFMANKSVSELTACFAENSFKPAFAFLPKTTSEMPYFIYDNSVSCALIVAMPTETPKSLNGGWSIRIGTPFGSPFPAILLRHTTAN